jgi:hypothetical protein
MRPGRDHAIDDRHTGLVAIVTPRHADDRPFGTARAIVGILSCVLGLAFNFLVFAFAATADWTTTTRVVTTTILIVIGELALTAGFGIAFARRRESRAAKIGLAICVGIACGAAPWLLWMLFAAVFAT